MKKKQIAIALLLSSLLQVMIAQKGSSSYHPKPSVYMDSLKCITLDKVIFYRDPLVFESNTLIDTAYIPAWYNAYCLLDNPQYFNYDASKAVKYSSKTRGRTQEQTQSAYDKYKLKKSTEKEEIWMAFRKFFYVFAEQWVTLKSTGQKYVIVIGNCSNEKIENLRLRLPKIGKNKGERFDTLHLEKDKRINSGAVRSVLFFVSENDTLKLPMQFETEALFSNKEVDIRWSIAEFKDVLYRTPVYILSEIENKKRIFKTMGKDNLKEPHKVKQVSDHP